MSTDARGMRGRRRGSTSHGSRGRSNYYPGGCVNDPLNLNEAPSATKDTSDTKPISLEVGAGSPEQTKRKRKWSGAAEERPASPTGKKPRSASNSPVKIKEKDSTKNEKSEESNAKVDKKSKREYFNNKYCYGNFDRYYGARLDPGQSDSRLDVLKKEWFERKSILDIGCNVGFLTLSIARDFGPRRILGIDIDEHLVGVARKNIRHYCDKDTEFNGKFPASFCNQFGPIANQPLSFSTKFPDNVWFRKENYVLENDELLELVEEEFNVILALSITKWIHLNFGDDGMRRFFKRAFRQLLPGGRFVLEPQQFDSYKKRAKMTPHLKANYDTIEFKPEDFEMYLLEEIGFEKVEHLGVPNAKSKGFQRPVDVYVKKAPSFMDKKGNLTSGPETKSPKKETESKTS